jgi:dTDP-4-amino-4,6-dideoxygalactose transaminase
MPRKPTAAYRGQRIGSFGAIAAFSFIRARIRACGEGGITIRDAVGRKCALRSRLGGITTTRPVSTYRMEGLQGAALCQASAS